MSKYLMLINIGPVQDFIATARRSRDLWFGSWFLSEISKTAARTIVRLNNQDYESLIFPSANDKDLIENSDFNAANKILAITEENPQNVGEKIKDAIDKRLDAICKNAFDDIKAQFNRDLLKKQLADLIEFYWTAVKFDGSDEKYEKAHKEVEYLAAARKNTREFKAVDWGANIPKSSLDGKRESVIPENLYPKDHYKDKDKMAKYLYDKFRVRDKERLCGVGLLKRLGSESEKNNVASTPHIAALPFLKGLENKTDRNKIAKTVEDYVNSLAKPKVIGTFDDFYARFGKLNDAEHKIFKNFDAKILFENRLKEHFENDEDLVGAKNALREFFEKTGTKQSELSPYYAILLADGDNMGKAIEAQLKNDKPIDKHRKLSKALSEFANDVKEIVNEKYESSLFYAGGDDVLALVPLHTVLDCAKELNQTFFEKLKDFKNKDGISPTLSVGIAVAHFLEPLSDALEFARKAEKAAKDVDGKNALAIIVDKRSGTSREIKGKFSQDKDSKGIIEYLRQLIDFDKQGDISRQAAYELRDLAKRLEVFGDKSKTEEFAEIKTLEAKRIFKRKLKDAENEDFKNGRFSELIKILEGKDGDKKDTDKKNGAAKLAEELITAKIFADAELTANGENNSLEVLK